MQERSLTLTVLTINSNELVTLIKDKHMHFLFLVFDFCRFCVVIRFFHPATTANELRLRTIFYPRFYPLHLFSYLNSWKRASVFPFECSVLNKGTTGMTRFWLGIEPGTSRTQSQHYTTRLSRRRYFLSKYTWEKWNLLGYFMAFGG